MARLGFIGWGGGRFLVFPSNAAEMVFATTSVAFLTFCWANFPLVWDGVAALPPARLTRVIARPLTFLLTMMLAFQCHID
jgi:hypothetical protein